MSQPALHVDERVTGKSLFAVFLPDVILAAMLMGVAVFSASRIIVALTVLCIVTLIQEAWTYAIRQRETRLLLRHYEYGVGKLEQAANLTIAVVMLLASLWLVNMVFGSESGGGGVTAPRDLVVAAIVGALYTLRHACFACTELIARRDVTDQAAADATTGPGRFATIAVVQLVVTFAALARDPLFVSWAETLGTLLIALALFVSGVGMFWTAVLDLVDHPLDPSEQSKIIRLLSELDIDDARLQDLRARRAGCNLFVELTLVPATDQSLSETQESFALLRRHLETHLTGADVLIKVA